MGLSQDMLALNASIDRSFIGQIERGERNVTLATIVKVAASLKVDAGELVQGLQLEE